MSSFSSETIRIENLRVECIIGARPREREQTQPLLVTLAFPQSFATAAESDRLEETVDYSALAREMREFIVEGRFKLLETLARRLALHLAERFDLSSLTLSIHKPQAIADSDGAVVELVWHRNGEPE